ncbi:uncharacterized protein LOC128674641 [Plodia interpunctella]|uniref:uncharacterized protein LOC128674641 n=1 Tax=Plodia interpunctella TaxID=58824 RepID=UPI002367680E|nr:uncharacterized protein LOC128674641 [Plodia interpunctella]
MWLTTYFLIMLTLPLLIRCNDLLLDYDDNKKIQTIVDIVKIGRERTDWKNIICAGKLSDPLYKQLGELSSTFAVITDDYGVEFEDAVPYAPHTFLFGCTDFDTFEDLFMTVLGSPYWHPLTNVIMFYESPLTNDLIAKIFFILLYYKVYNVIIVQFDDTEQALRLIHYNPYVSGEDHNNYGCWTARNIGIPPINFDEGFVCVEGCQNITQQSKFRANNLGTCVAFQTNIVSYGDEELLRHLNLFEELAKNLHGFPLRAYATEVKPFLIVNVQGNGTYTIGSRDGNVWNTISKAMNFTIDLYPVARTIKSKFNFELNIQQIFGLSRRKADLYLIPIYEFDLIVVDLDYTFPVKESGLCLIAHRAGFETNLFDAKLLEENYELVIEFVFCIICMWFLFFAYSAVERNNLSLDQMGKDLINVFRSVMSIGLYKAPRRRSFRIFLGTSIWCFFVLNFFMQAAIISFFSSIRRGKDVNTFEDVIAKEYPIEGVASPDAILPDTEDRFNKINSKLVSVQDLFECTERMINDSRRFCLVDCAVGRYLERNKLNDKGQQYLHVVEKDRFHSLYLNMIFSKNSPLTKVYNGLVLRLFEAGLVKKWEEYRFTEIKEEAEVKPLGMDDLMGIFKCYGLLVCLCLFVFLVEIILGFIKYLTAIMKRYLYKKDYKMEENKNRQKTSRVGDSNLKCHTAGVTIY